MSDSIGPLLFWLSPVFIVFAFAAFLLWRVVVGTGNTPFVALVVLVPVSLFCFVMWTFGVQIVSDFRQRPIIEALCKESTWGALSSVAAIERAETLADEKGLVFYRTEDLIRVGSDSHSYLRSYCRIEIDKERVMSVRFGAYWK